MFNSELKRAIAGVSMVMLIFIIVFVALAVSLTTRYDIASQTALACTPSPSPTPTPSWDSYPLIGRRISDGADVIDEIKNPPNNSVYPANETIACTGTRATDFDRKTAYYQQISHAEDAMAASSAYPYWTKTAGSWSGTHIGTAVTWIAPATAQTVTLDMVEKDLPNGVPSGEGGSKSDGELHVASHSVSIVVPSVTITAYTLPNDGVSFTTNENNIQFTADIKPDSLDTRYNSKIKWDFEDDPGQTGDSGNPNDPSDGNIVTCVVTAPLASNGRTYKLNYRVRAFLSIGGVEYASSWVCVIQDDKDLKRQRYMDFSASVPSRSDLLDAAAYGNGDLSFSTVACHGGSSNLWCTNPSKSKIYPTCKDASHGFFVPEAVVNTSNVYRTIEDAYTTGTIDVSCVYRCPIHNKCVGGVIGSKHMAGKAFDFANSTSKENYEIAHCAFHRGVPYVSLYVEDSSEGEDFSGIHDDPAKNYTVRNYTHGHVTASN